MENIIDRIKTFSDFLRVWNETVQSSNNLEYDLRKLLKDLDLENLEFTDSEFDILGKMKNSFDMPSSVEVSLILQKYRESLDQYMPYRQINL
jgi:hypothetical protein